MNKTNSSLAKSYCKYDEPYSQVERAVQMAALSLISGFGVFGNLFVIILAAKYTVRRNLHFLIINMAVSDTLVIVLILLYAAEFTLGYKLWNNDVAATFWCKAITFLGSTFEALTLVTLLIISVERYRITRRRAVQMVRPYSAKKRVFLLSFSWLISIIINSYEAVLRRFDESNKYGTECGLVEHLIHYKLTLIRIILYIILSVLLLVLSILTLRRLSSPQAIEGNLSDEQRNLRRKRINDAVRMVLYSLLLYCCCYLPFLFSQMLIAIAFLFPSVYASLDLGCCFDRRAMYFITVLFLPVMNSALSPCVYLVCLSDFRQAAKALPGRNNVT